MSQRGLPRPPIHDAQFSYQWREWFRRVYVRTAEDGQILFDQLSLEDGEIPWIKVSKTGSNLTDIETRRHRDLQDLQGGTTAEYYHLTAAQHTEITGFFDATDITAAEAENLTDGSDADALHTHPGSGQEIVQKILLTSADDLVTDGLGHILIGSA